MTRIILHGCSGKMGNAISQLAQEHSDLEIVAGIDRKAENLNFPVFTSLKECDVAADVLIDFSNSSATDQLLAEVLAKKMPLVLCTTGLSSAQIEAVHQAALEIPILFSANMSLGVNLMASLVQKAAQILAQSGFDIEIIEKHHHHKKDAPSGTALYLADSINQVLPEKYTYQFDRSQQNDARNRAEIGIISLRGGNIAGEHQVIFAGEDEILEIHHKAGSRRIFAIGALSAAHFLKSQTAGLYSMNDVIG